MINNFFSADHDKFSGPSVPKSAILGCIDLAIIILIATIAFAAPLPKPITYLLSALLACVWAALSVIWLRSYVAAYINKIEKHLLTTKRFQNKSNYLDSILQDSTDIIFTTDIDCFILKFNRGAQIHFKYSQEEIVGKPLRHIFVNEADLRKILNTVLLCGKSMNEEIPMKTKEGEILLVTLSMSEMKNVEGQIIGLVITAKDITEKKKLEMELVKKNELLSKLAITDSLTELYNSRYFYEQLSRELTRFKRNPGRKLSLILLDVDHFKQLNDSQGHQMGDHVLRTIGDIIRVCIRKDIDSGYRYGGDEFTIMLPDTDQNQSKFAAERIQKQFAAFKFGTCSLSIGIAEARAEDDEKSIVHRADEAMYHSKRTGRSKIVLESDERIETEGTGNCRVE